MIRSRNTPTGVGKTSSRNARNARNKKHPHGRGEDEMPKKTGNFIPETPPRAWGRRNLSLLFNRAVGNTPTGVGKTHVHARKGVVKKKHPHGRGED